MVILVDFVLFTNKLFLFVVCIEHLCIKLAVCYVQTIDFHCIVHYPLSAAIDPRSFCREKFTALVIISLIGV